MEGESSGRGQGLDTSKHSTVGGSVPPPQQASPLAFFPSFKAGSLGPAHHPPSLVIPLLL